MSCTVFLLHHLTWLTPAILFFWWRVYKHPFIVNPLYSLQYATVRVHASQITRGPLRFYRSCVSEVYYIFKCRQLTLFTFATLINRFAAWQYPCLMMISHLFSSTSLLEWINCWNRVGKYINFLAYYHPSVWSNVAFIFYYNYSQGQMI